MINVLDLQFGIDLGGTKIEGIVLKDHDPSQIWFRERIPTEGHLGYEHILRQIQIMVEKMIGAANVRPLLIGLGAPGIPDPGTGLMKNCNTTALNGKNLREDLEALLKIRFIVANDANCFALAETKLGAGYDEKNGVVFGVIMGTGVGGGLVVNGQLIQGKHGIAGEWGHNFLDDSGGKCYCGKVGCVETVLSGPALEAYYYGITGVKKPLAEIVQLSSKSDEAAQKTLKRLYQFSGKALANVINILDPDMIIIGGGVGNIESLYDEVPKTILPYLFNPELKTKIVKPKLGDSAGVFGAAMLT
jgi:fructokinase